MFSWALSETVDVPETFKKTSNVVSSAKVQTRKIKLKSKTDQ